MKRKLLLLAVMFLLCCGGLFAACQSDPVPNELKVPESIVLKVSDTSFDFAAESEVVLSDGSTAVAEADASAVQFGKAGAYDVKYSYGSLEKTVKVYIYAMPTLAESEVTLTYKQAVAENALQSAIIVKDSFGETLEISVVDDGGFYQSSGAVNFGNYDVSVSATDAAGNVLNGTVKVTVAENAVNNPAFSVQEVVYDLSSVDPLRITVDLKSRALKNVYLGDTRLDAGSYTVEDSDIVFVMSDIGVQETTLRVETEGGYATIPCKITDDNPPVFDLTADIDGYIYTVGETIDLPRGETINNQKITYSYTLDEQEYTENSTVFTQTGNHVFCVTGTSNGKTTEKEVAFRVVSAEEYELTIDPVTSEQFANRYTVPTGVDETFTFEFTPGELGDRNASYALTSIADKAGRVWYNRIELNPDYLASVNMGEYGTMTLDILLTQATNVAFWVAGNTMQFSGDAFSVVTADGTPVKYADLASHLNEWLTVTIPVDAWTGLDTTGKRIAIGVDQGTLYISDLTWQVAEFSLNAVQGEVFAVGEAPDFTCYYENVSSIEFEITDPDAQTSVYTLETIGEFIPTKTGVYTLVLSAEFRGETDEAEVTFYVTDQPVSSIYAVYKDQVNRFTIPAGMHVDQGFSFGYDEESDMFKMTVGETNQHWYNRFELNQEYFKNTDFVAYDTLVATVRFTAETDIYVWENSAVLQFSTGQIRLYDPATETYVTELTEESLNKDLTLYIPISGYDLSDKTQRFAIGMSAPVTVYFDDFRFEKLGEESEDFIIAENGNQLDRLVPNGTVCTVTYDAQKEVGGKTGMFVLATSETTGSSWSNRIDICTNTASTSFMQSLVAAIPGYRYLTFELSASAKTDIVVWLNKTAMRLSSGGFKLYDAEGEEVAYENWNGTDWVTVKIDLSAYDPAAADKRVAFGADETSVEVYFRDVRLTEKFAVTEE